MGSNVFRSCWIPGREEFDDVTGDVHASGGVETRSDSEGNILRTQAAGYLAKPEQLLQTGIHWVTQTFEAEADEDAVFARKGHSIRDGSDGSPLEKGRNQPRAIRLLQ